MAIQQTDGGSTTNKTSLAASTTAIANRLKAAKAAYYTAVNNKESSTIVNKAKAAFDEAQKAYDLSAPQRGDISAAKDEMAYALGEPGRNDMAAAAAKTTSTTSAVTSTTTTSSTTSTSNVETDNFQASIDEAAGMDTTSRAVDAKGNPLLDEDGKPITGGVEFTSLTPEEQAAIGNIGEGAGLNPTLGFSAAQIPGAYKSDPSTGILYLDGNPYTGSYNGFNYVNGKKTEATVGKVAKSMADFTNSPGAGSSTFNATGTDPNTLRDAYALIKDILNSYGLGDEIADELTKYMSEGKGANEALLLIKQNPNGAYKKRFAGNELRIAAGLNVLTEDAYLKLEDSYAETLRAYGLGNMLSTDRKQNQAMFSKWMGNDLAAPEFKSRIQLATDRVINADPATKDVFKQFYPNLTDADLVSYFLAPSDTLPKLQEKVTAAEIGGAAIGQGLATNLTSATELAKFGIDKNAAIQGYANVKEALPTTQKLGDIYSEAGIKYDQATGEAEFLKLNQDAAEKRKRLKSLERAAFQGETGISQGSGLVRSVQGKF